MNFEVDDIIYETQAFRDKAQSLKENVDPNPKIGYVCSKYKDGNIAVFWISHQLSEIFSSAQFQYKGVTRFKKIGKVDKYNHDACMNELSNVQNKLDARKISEQELENYFK